MIIHLNREEGNRHLHSPCIYNNLKLSYYRYIETSVLGSGIEGWGSQVEIITLFLCRPPMHCRREA